MLSSSLKTNYKTKILINLAFQLNKYFNIVIILKFLNILIFKKTIELYFKVKLLRINCFGIIGNRKRYHFFTNFFQ